MSVETGILRIVSQTPACPYHEDVERKESESVCQYTNAY
jgi:hypothetical protein